MDNKLLTNVSAETASAILSWLGKHGKVGLRSRWQCGGRRDRRVGARSTRAGAQVPGWSAPPPPQDVPIHIPAKTVRFAREVFTLIDVDKSGTLEPEELQQVFQVRGRCCCCPRLLGSSYLAFAAVEGGTPGSGGVRMRSTSACCGATPEFVAAKCLPLGLCERAPSNAGSQSAARPDYCAGAGKERVAAAGHFPGGVGSGARGHMPDLH